MTPAERAYDRDLVKSMRREAKMVEPRSKRIALTLRMAADRIEKLNIEVPVAAPARPPASTPDQDQPEPVREDGLDHRRGEADPRR
jgi:hypothetical protein